jgi:hypothetical protein
MNESEKTRRTSGALAAVLAGLLVALVLPAAAAADEVCPPTFTLVTGVDDADRNGDGKYCTKVIAGGSHLAVVRLDNHLPDGVIQALASDGSEVLVDTETGGVTVEP